MFSNVKYILSFGSQLWAHQHCRYKLKGRYHLESMALYGGEVLFKGRNSANWFEFLQSSVKELRFCKMAP